jgi:ABC-type transporter Mla maintaining outer membrane lipid asymmetry ATPase subunit MlaF
MASSAPLHIANVRRAYNGLRPLRMNELTIAEGERVAVSGLDAGAAEVLVNLVTGASIPDEGQVVVFGRNTASISDGEEWLASLDRFGIVTPRAVLLDSATLLQNLAMPVTLDIEPVPPDVAARVVRLARDAGLDERWLDRPIGSLDAAARARAHLARAVALDPALLIMEHPTVGLAAGEGKSFGEVVASVAGGRSLTTLIISEDVAFSEAAATRRLALQGATGDLKPRKRGFFGLLLGRLESRPHVRDPWTG